MLPAVPGPKATPALHHAHAPRTLPQLVSHTAQVRRSIQAAVRMRPCTRRAPAGRAVGLALLVVLQQLLTHVGLRACHALQHVHGGDVCLGAAN